MDKQPPYKDPSEAIRYLKEICIADPVGTWRNLSWREIAEQVSGYMDGETNKAEIWNVAHEKYKCPPEIAKALRKMGLLRSTKRYRYFFEVSNEEEYKAFKKHVLKDKTFTEWVWEHVITRW
jgi:ribosomal protein S21